MLLPATAVAQPYEVTVQGADGKLQTVVADLPPGTTLEQLTSGQVAQPLPGTVVSLQELPTQPPPPEPPPPPADPAPPPTPDPPAQEPAAPEGAPAPLEQAPEALSPPKAEPKLEGVRKLRERSGSHKRGKRPSGQRPSKGKPRPEAESHRRGSHRKPAPRPQGALPPQEPGSYAVLPAPWPPTEVPDFVIRGFGIPPFLLSIYQAAGIEYGIRWEILAAINEIETDYGRNLNVSSAGAVGWMQFLPASWRSYGVDANKDGRRDPYNPVDAIFAAARYLKAAGYDEDVRRAIFAYNHADWYVDSVLLRARLIASVPGDLIGALTGLAEGRFPVLGQARLSSADPRSIEIFAGSATPVIAVNDGRIVRLGYDTRRGHFVVLQDVYGNRYTYTHLGSVATHHAVPRADVGRLNGEAARAPSAAHAEDPAPTTPASAGRQPARNDPTLERGRGAGTQRLPVAPHKQRLFAHPSLPAARAHGGSEQLAAAGISRRVPASREVLRGAARLASSTAELRRLERGSRVVAGTVIGHLATTDAGRRAQFSFSIRPAGRGAPRIDPKPILDGWKLLKATAIYRASGRNVLRGERMSIGQIMLLPKPLLERRVLADDRIEIYDCGRDDIRSGRIDRRVLATLAYLAESGFAPKVTSLECGHPFYTKSGHVSHHTSGNAVDISAIGGVPIIGHQQPGGVAEQAVRQLLQLQGTLAPAQVISLFDLGGASFAMADHGDHIHVGFQPMYGPNARLGRQVAAVLKPGQWSELVARLRKIRNPVVRRVSGAGTSAVSDG
jgi:hypothetical protein